MPPKPKHQLNESEIATHALSLFPDFIIEDLVKSNEFAQALRLKPSFDVVLGNKIRLSRADFFVACRAALVTPNSVHRVLDEARSCFEVTAQKSVTRPTLIKVAGAQHQFFVNGVWSLNPNTEIRLCDFRHCLSEAGLSPNALPAWKAILSERPLMDEEIVALNDELNQTHVKFQVELQNQLSQGQGKLSELVPIDRRYWDNFCGLNVTSKIEDFARTAASQKIHDHLAWDTEKGARYSLLFSSHHTFMDDCPIVDMAADDLLRLAKWAKTSGPVLAKVGMIELGMQVLKRVPKLAPTLRSLILEILGLNPEDRSGQLYAAMSLFVFVDGQMSQSGSFQDFPPSLRRHAAFAHAGLLEWLTFGRIDYGEFGGALLASSARQFYIQTLIDLRQEPRWVPDFASADQLKNELIGRISNVASKFLGTLADGPLRRLVENTLLKRVDSPRYFYPGPLEGRLGDVPVPISPELEAIIDETLQSTSLTFENLIGVLALGPMFTVEDEKIMRIIAMIRQSGHRVSGQVDSEKRERVFVGFSRLACASRTPQLAEELRLMMRKVRREEANRPNYEHEFFTALTAAAAHSDFMSWAKFIGEWGNELAFEIEDKEEATQLHASMQIACEIEPRLRHSLGRGLAAIDALLGM